MTKAILALAAILTLNGQAIQAQSNLIFFTAKVVAPDPKMNPAAGAPLILRIVVHNRTKESLKVDALRTMGKEQFVDNRKAFDHPNFMCAYVDELKASFVLNGVTNFVHSVPFPYSGEVPAGGFAEAMCLINTPRQSGVYQILLQPVNSTGTALENLWDRHASPRSVRPSELGVVRIGDFKL